jgi:hypothetical protein
VYKGLLTPILALTAQNRFSEIEQHTNEMAITIEHQQSYPVRFARGALYAPSHLHRTALFWGGSGYLGYLQSFFSKMVKSWSTSVTRA